MNEQHNSCHQYFVLFFVLHKKELFVEMSSRLFVYSSFQSLTTGVVIKMVSLSQPQLSYGMQVQYNGVTGIPK